jgi:hypothetical protein
MGTHIFCDQIVTTSFYDQILRQKQLRDLSVAVLQILLHSDFKTHLVQSPC